MADVKVSALPVLAAGDLDLVNDMIMVVDVSAGQSKRMPPGELLRAAAPYLATVMDFATGSLLPTVSLTRASTGYRYNSSGVLVSMGTDVSRFTYDPATLTPRGFLLEGAATNILTHSENLSDNTAWAKTNCTLSVGAIAAPDGAMTADAVIENVTGVTGHGPGRQVTFTSGVTYVVSFFAKADTRTWAYSYMDPVRFGGSGYCYFDLANGVLGAVSSGMNAFMVPLPNGWYRCVAIGTSTTTGLANFGTGLATGSGTHNYAGDGTSKLYMWGFSIAADTTLTSYVKTTSAAVTRAADIALWTNPLALTDQCWVVKGRTPRKLAAGSANTIFQVDDNGFSRRCIYYQSGRLYVLAQVANVTQCLLDLGVVANDTDFSIAARFADANFAASLNGGAIVTETTAGRLNPFGMTTARIGCVAGNAFAWNSTIRSIETRRTATNTDLPLLAA